MIISAILQERKLGISEIKQLTPSRTSAQWQTQAATQTTDFQSLFIIIYYPPCISNKVRN